MSLTPCPTCGLPRDENAGAQPCPVCGQRLSDPPLSAEPVVVIRPEPTPVPSVAPAADEHSTFRNWILVVGTLLVGVLILGFFLWEPSPKSEPTFRSQPVVSNLPENSPLRELECAPPPRLVQETPPVRSETEIAPTPRQIVSEPPRSVTDGFVTIKLNRPNETYSFDRLAEGNKIRLVGTVKKLILEGVEDNAFLDASELITGDVSITGKISGNSTLKVQTTGTVSIRDPIEGGSKVSILGATYVSTASATSATKPGGIIQGGATVEITAKSVALAGVITGGSKVLVTLTTGGSLRFKEVAGGAKLFYRQSNPLDAPPRITPGDVREGAECRAVE